MLPFVTEELRPRIPPALQMPHPEDDSQNQVHYMQDMVLKRHLMVRFTHNCQFANVYNRVLKVNYGVSQSIKEGEWLEPIPKDRKYAMGHVKTQ